MKTIALVLVALCLGLNAPGQADKWEELKSYDGRFRLMAPAPMQHKVDSLETSLGIMAYHTFFYHAPKETEKTADNLLYMLSYCDYPEYSVHSDSVDLIPEFFEATIESAVGSVGGKLLYSSEQDYRGYPGRYWRIDYLNGQAVIKTRALLVGARYYALQTIMLKNKGLNTSTNRFMDSFQLME